MTRPLTLGAGNDPEVTAFERTLDDKLDFRHPTDSTKDIRLALGDEEIEIIQDPFGTPTLIGVIPGGSGSSAWGSITGTLSAQTDLQAALDAKVPTSRTVSAGTGLTGGGDLTANRTFSLDNTAVTPGTYGGNGGVTTSFTVDAQGRITGAAQFLIEIDAAVVSGQFVTSQIANDAVTDAKLRNSAALSVIGRSANSTGDPGDIAAGTDGQVFRRAGGALGWGAIDLGSANARTGQLPAANVVTGTSGAAIPLLNGNNTHSGTSEFTGGHYINGGARTKIELTTSNKSLGASDFAVVMGSLFSTLTATLPASPADGQTYRIKRYGGSNVTIARNGNTINDVAADFTLTADGQSVDLIYSSGSGWWTF